MATSSSKEQCPSDDCLYYKKRNLFHRHHFLWICIISTILVFLAFAFLTLHYNKNQEKIVTLHSEYCNELRNNIQESIIVKDSCYYVNDLMLQTMRESEQNISQLLELQFSKLQADFTILSLWAGILMIVFLVFSIYSVFKTDELMKQSRDVLQHADEASDKVKKDMEAISTQVQTETEKATLELRQKTDAELQKIKEEINKTTQGFKEVTEKKAKEYTMMYQSYLKELQKANESSQSVINLLISTIRSSDSDSKPGKSE